MNTVGVRPDPLPGCKRGTFHSRYLLEKAKLDHRYDGWRLLDCLLTLCEPEDPAYLDKPEAGVFAVVDMHTKEKAFFEMPFDCTPTRVTEMVNSHFAATSIRVANKLWCV